MEHRGNSKKIVFKWHLFEFLMSLLFQKKPLKLTFKMVSKIFVSKLTRPPDLSTSQKLNWCTSRLYFLFSCYNRSHKWLVCYEGKYKMVSHLYELPISGKSRKILILSTLYCLFTWLKILCTNSAFTLRTLTYANPTGQLSKLKISHICWIMWYLFTFTK